MTKRKTKKSDPEDREQCSKCHKPSWLLWDGGARDVYVCRSCVSDEVFDASNFARWKLRHDGLTDLQQDIAEALSASTVQELLELAQTAEKVHAPFATMVGIAAVQLEQVLNLIMLVCAAPVPDAVDLAADDKWYATEPADPDECGVCGHSRYAHEDGYSAGPGACSAEGAQLLDGVQVEGQLCECRDWQPRGSHKALKLARNKHDDQPSHHSDK